jgi:DNA-binding NarL/FixJ family response regulator
MSQLNILVADDHTLIVRGLRKILEEQPDWRVVGEASDGREAVRLGTDLNPDVALIDVSMPNLNGVEAAAQLAQQAPAVKVLMLSMYSDEAFVGRALRAGARGYLLKDSADADLVRAVSAVAAGDSFFSPSIASRMLSEYVDRLDGNGSEDRFETLSAREREVFQLVAEGHTNRQIAALLSIKPATVETHRAHIMQKLDLHSTAAIVRYAVQRGIVK